jgi:hypothetical protein
MQTKKEIKKILELLNIKNYIINNNLTVDINISGTIANI